MVIVFCGNREVEGDIIKTVQIETIDKGLYGCVFIRQKSCNDYGSQSSIFVCDHLLLAILSH